MSEPVRSVSVHRVVVTDTPAGDARGSAELVGAQVQALLAEAGMAPLDAAAAAATVAAEIATAVEAAR